jgi:hypothetical protein
VIGGTIRLLFARAKERGSGFRKAEKVGPPFVERAVSARRTEATQANSLLDESRGGPLGTTHKPGPEQVTGSLERKIGVDTIGPSTGEFIRQENIGPGFRPAYWYILNNPVKAGIVRDWRDYPFTFCPSEGKG